jgi:phospho-N-acetylmuramoyl-pentapeptide-transferase
MPYGSLLPGALGSDAGPLAGAGARSLLACGTALLVSLALGGPLIAWLRSRKLGEKTEKTPIEDAALRHRIESKSGTPTMGGLMVLGGLLVACLLWADMQNPHVSLALMCALALGLLGLTDDQLKLRRAGHKGRGLKARHKLLAQAIVGAAVGFALVRHHASAGGAPYSVPLVPAVGGRGVAAVLFVAWSAFVVGTMSNATNVTDGLDGLLAGLTPPAATVLAGACWAAGSAPVAARLGMAFVPGAQELSVFCGALCGACMGFLWYNRHPAKVFMGDVGSLAIGGGMAAAALAARQELVLGLASLVFLVEFGSSLLQISFFKLSGRRILPIAPIHHFFEMRGDPEPRIVHSFHLWGAVAALAGLNLMCL